MNRRESNDLKRAHAAWTIAGASLIVAAVAGSSIIAVAGGTADAGTLVWGMVGIALLLEALVLFAYGLRLRHGMSARSRLMKRGEATGRMTAPIGHGFPCWVTARPASVPPSRASKATAGRAAGATQRGPSEWKTLFVFGRDDRI